MIFAALLLVLAPPSASSEESIAPVDQPETLKIDILVKQPGDECEQSTDDEIIVCAEGLDNERHRLRPIKDAEKYEKDESKAEFSIAENATLASETEQAELGSGVQSKRAMVRLKAAF